jgi:DNA-binding beta-propeller fold protein YncE
MFRAFVLPPFGQIRSFGRAGSAPGKFNIVSAIAADDDGNLYVTDMLKSAVIVFDKDLQFLREFGYRGDEPQNITTPIDIVVGGDKIFVSQLAKQGVSVFQIKHGGDDGDGEATPVFRRRGPRFK